MTFKELAEQLQVAKEEKKKKTKRVNMKVNELIIKLQQLISTESELGEVDIKLETEPTYKNSFESDIEDVLIHHWYDSRTKKEYKTVILVEERND